MRTVTYKTHAWQQFNTNHNFSLDFVLDTNLTSCFSSLICLYLWCNPCHTPYPQYAYMHCLSLFYPCQALCPQYNLKKVYSEFTSSISSLYLAHIPKHATSLINAIFMSGSLPSLHYLYYIFIYLHFSSSTFSTFLFHPHM